LKSEDAIAACSSTPERFDAILVGCSLSEKKARRLPALLHALAPNLPILVAADPTESFDVDTLVSAGVSEVVSRPIIADEVAAVLARCLQTTAASDRTAAFAADGETMRTKRASGAPAMTR
jgi:DNA-binding NarL/FixJ family response regulator